MFKVISFKTAQFVFIYSLFHNYLLIDLYRDHSEKEKPPKRTPEQVEVIEQFNKLQNSRSSFGKFLKTECNIVSANFILFLIILDLRYYNKKHEAALKNQIYFRH